ncbi:hypothetical protein BHE74_00052844 [Ensete ventricosum]|nr:hypothetical protein BHE74_00052844 [Ensete ventricosum]
MICCASGCVVADSQQPTAAKRTMVPDCTKNASLSIPVPRDSRGDGSVRHHIMCGVTKIEDLVQSTEVYRPSHDPYRSLLSYRRWMVRTNGRPRCEISVLHTKRTL